MRLHYETLAAAAGADLLCLGVELNFADGAYPDEWRRLVAETRAIYAGPLTYAANHSPGANGGGYPGVRFWDALDFIGIDAYFSLAVRAPPTAPVHRARLRERSGCRAHAVGRGPIGPHQS
jgi:hypothetical protein